MDPATGLSGSVWAVPLSDCLILEKFPESEASVSNPRNDYNNSIYPRELLQDQNEIFCKTLKTGGSMQILYKYYYLEGVFLRINSAHVKALEHCVKLIRAQLSSVDEEDILPLEFTFIATLIKSLHLTTQFHFWESSL